MKKILIILFFFVTVLLNANTFYVATTGNNGAAGTLAAPWATFHYAVTQAYVGDTVYFRGGVYYHTTTVYITHDGTYGNEIVFINYPNETPEFDCSNFPESTHQEEIPGIKLSSANYIKFIGLTVKNIIKIYLGDGRAYGFYADASHHITWDRCTVHHSYGRGFYSYRSADLFYINCDAWRCADPQTLDPGNAGTGFVNVGSIHNSMEDTVSYYGCRAWKCSDQGFAGACECLNIWKDCWSLANGLHSEGYTSGAGMGFKLGYTTISIDSVQIIVNNCVAAHNYTYGFDENTASQGNKMNMRVFNNTSYDNYWGFVSTDYRTEEDNTNIYRNNLSYKSDIWDMGIDKSAIHSRNSWDAPYTTPTSEYYFKSPATVNDLDFMSLDSTGFTAARQADGSFPNNNCFNYFLRLTSTSDLINAGIDVGLSYDGAAPDLGFSEYVEGDPPMVYTTVGVWTSPTTATSGGNVYNEGETAVTVRGVCWNTTGAPTISDSKTSDGTGSGIFSSSMTGLTKGLRYYIRAYATNSSGTGYGNEVGMRLSYLHKNNKVLFKNGKILYID